MRPAPEKSFDQPAIPARTVALVALQFQSVKPFNLTCAREIGFSGFRQLDIIIGVFTLQSR